MAVVLCGLVKRDGDASAVRLLWVVSGLSDENVDK